MKLGVNIFVIRVRNLKILLAITVFTLLALLIFTNKAQAASLNVVSGTDGINENGQCQLSEAIQNVNDQTQTNDDCIAGDGNNDTINLPSGNITLVSNLPGIYKSLTINGQGMGQTIINGNQNYRMFSMPYNPLSSFSVEGLTITDYRDFGIESQGNNISISNLEITGVVPNNSEVVGIKILNHHENNSMSVNISNLYIHDLQTSASDIMQVLAISNSHSNVSAQVNISNATISNIVNSSGSINTVALGNGLFGGAVGIFDATVRNLTIHNISALGSVNGLVGEMVVPALG